MVEILVPISFFAMVAAIVIAPRYFRSIERQKVADTLRAAIEAGQPLPIEVIDAMSRNLPTPRAPASPARDLRVGLIWLGVAVGIACFGIALGFVEPEMTFVFLGLAAFPGFIGLAFVVLGLINRKKV
jgi:hypothetical protein